MFSSCKSNTKVVKEREMEPASARLRNRRQSHGIKGGMTLSLKKNFTQTLPISQVIPTNWREKSAYLYRKVGVLSLCAWFSTC